jgi:hypothetical protein
MDLDFVGFGDYFDQVSFLFWGVISTPYITPQKRKETWLKRTPKPTETKSINRLLDTSEY